MTYARDGSALNEESNEGKALREENASIGADGIECVMGMRT